MREMFIVVLSAVVVTLSFVAFDLYMDKVTSAAFSDGVNAMAQQCRSGSHT